MHSFFDIQYLILSKITTRMSKFALRIMARFQVNILGCGSATPSLRHKPSSQVIDYRDNLFMVDCGEGAQLAMRRMKLNYSRLNNIFISHLHGDHCFGLPGLLSTLSLHGKSGKVTVHTFKEGVEIFSKNVDFFCKYSSFEISFNIIEPVKGVIFENDALRVETFPLYHKVPCVGFIFREKEKPRHLRGDMAEFYHIPIQKRQGIKLGEDFVTPEGKVIPNQRLTTEADPSASYAYCSDTVYDHRVAQAVKGVDLLYHEATYASDKESQAHERWHSTAAEAALIAAEAGVKKLILGHFSKSYRDEERHLQEAREIFPNVMIANEGAKIDLL